MKSHIYDLRKIPRNLDFPLPLLAIGWMVCHRSPVKVLTEAYVCISYNRRQYSEEGFSGATLSVLKPGRNMTVAGSLQDEIFFSYRAEDAVQLTRLLKDRTIVGGQFTFTPEINALCAKLHDWLDRLHEPGMADSLDLLAIQLLNLCLVAVQNYAPQNTRDDLRIHEIATRLKRGENLDLLIRKYHFSRRSFYYAWKRVFSETPVRFRRNEMLKQAELLLRQTTMSVVEIAANCNFSNETCFYRLFRQAYHCTPTQYREHQGGQ
ncbi:MAG: AraC family transcriptional regulator [Victivallales bacterium]|nr:AraC family transcriptional regulator [Victivallales bacterium]